MDRWGNGGSRDRSTPDTEPDAADAHQVPVDRAGDDDRGADEFCETQRMARTDDEKWLVVDGQRGRRTEPAIPADALDDSRRQDQER